MRTWQPVGLMDIALAFLEKHCETEVTSRCPHCQGELSSDLKKEKLEENNVWYNHGPSNFKFFPKSESGYKEIKSVLQCAPWSSGPVTFGCLEVDGERMFQWTENEMEKHL